MEDVLLVRRRSLSLLNVEEIVAINTSDVSRATEQSALQKLAAEEERVGGEGDWNKDD